MALRSSLQIQRRHVQIVHVACLVMAALAPRQGILVFNGYVHSICSTHCRTQISLHACYYAATFRIIRQAFRGLWLHCAELTCQTGACRHRPSKLVPSSEANRHDDVVNASQRPTKSDPLRNGPPRRLHQRVLHVDLRPVRHREGCQDAPSVAGQNGSRSCCGDEHGR